MRSKNNLRTWIEIDTKALAHNYRIFRRLIGPKSKLMAVVKSNAYGHGLIDFSKQVVKLGVDWLGVDSIVEVIALRRAGIRKEILVLGYTQPINFPAAVHCNAVITISSLQSLRAILALSHSPKFHLKLDTGMHRQGFLIDDLARATALLARAPTAIRARLAGVYSHLAASFDSAAGKETRRQIALFEEALQMLAAAGFPRESLVKHLASTGGVISYPAARYDLVRVGLGLYGLGDSVRLRPCLSWKTIVSEVKTLIGGGMIGYDFTEQVKPGTKLAVCPIGYWHGFPRALSGRGEVMVRGKKAKVIGRVSMDMVVIDVTDIHGVKPGMVVTLIGDGLPAEHLATLAGTSPYEIITRLNPLIQKFYLP